MDCRGYPWTCVQCNSRLSSDAAGLTCDVCHAVFPIAGEVPVLVRRPDAYLRKIKLKLTLERLNVKALERKLLTPSGCASRIERARREARARERNQSLVERLCLPAIGDLSSQAEGPAAALIQTDTGWSAASLSAYFCADWADDHAFRNALNDELPSLVPRRGGGRAAVLGSGAGRLLSNLSEHFNGVVGVDLSLFALILSRRLLNGGKMELFEPKAQWRGVTLSGARRPPTNVVLVAADAAVLPFADGSLSLVVTQYLLDIVPDSARVAREINRVLELGGKWLNLGLPFRLRAEPPTADLWRAADMPAFASMFGFEISTTRERFVEHLDLTAFDAAAFGEPHNAVLFTAEKARDLAPDPLRIALRDHYAGKSDAVRALAPRIRAGETLAIRHTRSLSVDGETSFEEIKLGSSSRRTKITPSTRGLIEHLWRSLDGAQAIGGIIDGAVSMFGSAVPEDDILSIISRLNDEHVLEWDR